jgi:hypothetical protein
MAGCSCGLPTRIQSCATNQTRRGWKRSKKVLSALGALHAVKQKSVQLWPHLRFATVISRTTSASCVLTPLMSMTRGEYAALMLMLLGETVGTDGHRYT